MRAIYRKQNLVPMDFGMIAENQGGRAIDCSANLGQPPGQTLQPTALVHEAWLGADRAWVFARAWLFQELQKP
jgi:hypothetical protein